MSNPGPIAQAVGRIAYEFAQVQYLIPTYLHIIIAALFPIYTAAHASLSRPASAAKPKKSLKTKHNEESEDDEEDKPRMEGLSPTDAIMFPLTAGVALTALYFLIKWDKELLNKFLNWYMGLAGLYGVIKFLSDSKHIIHAFCFPSYYSTGSKTWHVDQVDRKVHNLVVEGNQKQFKTSPLPWILSRMPLPQRVSNALWTLRGLPLHKLTFKFYIHRIVALRTHFNIFHFLSIIEGVTIVAYFTFIAKPWYLTNLMGFAFSYTALQLISPTTFATGSLVLIGLFFYDIYMVFFTPMMVTVAKNLDIPIKLLFPRPTGPDETSSKRQYSMLGLGDVVLPGIVMGLALRFDLYLFYLRKQRSGVSKGNETDKNDEKTVAMNSTIVIKAPYVSPSKNWANHMWTTSLLGYSRAPMNKIPDAGQFPKTYFHASLVGYIAGMVVTLSAMHWSAHPQPALLYLVPGVLISLWGTALVRGDINVMWSFTEEEEEEVTKDEKKGSKSIKDEGEKEKTKDSRPSIFSSAHDSRREEAVLRVAKRIVEAGDSEPDEELMTTNGEEPKEKSSTTKVEALEKAFRRDRRNDLVFFSVSKYSPLQRHGSNKENEANWVPADKKVREGEPAGKRLRTG